MRTLSRSGLLLLPVIAACSGVPEPVPATPPAPPAAPEATAPPPPSAAPSAAPHAHAPGHTHWSYVGEGSPTTWGELSPEFETCKVGKHQTPIDVPKGVAKDKDLPAIVASYKPTPLALLNNGHTVQASAVGSSIALGKDTYELVQAHLHAPAEHTVEGKTFAAELHLVHKNAEGKLAVVGVLLKKGKDNKPLAPFFDHLPTEASIEPKPIGNAELDLSALVPAKSAYATYEGSLTTPPCSEGVRWVLLTKPGEVSQAQLDKWKAVFAHATNRPVQPIGDRKVRASK